MFLNQNSVTKSLAKQIESIRLDPTLREILKLRKAELGIGVGEYISLLIERDNTGRYRKPVADAWLQWQENRAKVILSDT